MNSRLQTDYLTFGANSDLQEIKKSWDKNRSAHDEHSPKFEDLLLSALNREMPFRLFAKKQDGEIIGVVWIILTHEAKRFTLGERLLLTLPARVGRLHGYSGSLDVELLSRALNDFGREASVDVFALGEVPIDSALHQIASSKFRRLLLSRPSRKASLHWFITMPSSYEEYLTSRSSKFRKSLRYYTRRLEAEFSTEMQVISQPDQIGSFLQDAEMISKLTYQWNVGQRLCNDADTLNEYLRRSEEGRLRCYLLTLDGKKVAFGRGELVNGVFSYETPGFDPLYARYSVGTVLLGWIIKDLIENADCKMFDFGEGGDELDYKSKFGNKYVPCEAIELVRWTPMGLTAYLLQGALNRAKTLGTAVGARSNMVRAFRKKLRQYGDKDAENAKRL